MGKNQPELTKALLAALQKLAKSRDGVYRSVMGAWGMKDAAIPYWAMKINTFTHTPAGTTSS